MLLQKEMMKVVVVTTATLVCAKLQPNHHHQQTNISFYRPDALPLPSQQYQSTKGMV